MAKSWSVSITKVENFSTEKNFIFVLEPDVSTIPEKFAGRLFKIGEKQEGIVTRRWTGKQI